MKERPNTGASPLRRVKLTVTSILLLVGSCASQKFEGPGLIQDVLTKAHASGSVAYWSPALCPAPYLPYPQFPEVRVSNHSGPPQEVLQDMFTGDPKMRVTQDPAGIIRMSETGISSDFLDIKIHHIEFSDYEHHEPVFTGPNMALLKILLTPEVQDFKKRLHIGPSGFHLPGNATEVFRPHAYGELDEVTVSQALDYVLHIFPGFWIYGNCTNKEGDREIFVRFIENTQ